MTTNPLVLEDNAGEPYRYRFEAQWNGEQVVFMQAQKATLSSPADNVFSLTTEQMRSLWTWWYYLQKGKA